MSRSPSELAADFNAAINAADVDALAALMSDDHRFVDSAGGSVSGRPACVEAWRGFFADFPGYRNTFADLHESGGIVTITGRSDCPGQPALTGPAIWRATIVESRVTEWRVYDDTAVNRAQLDIGD